MDSSPRGSSVHEISQGRVLEWVAISFSRIDHILGHKSGLGKFKKIEIIPSIFSDHNVVRLDVNCRKIPWTVEPGSLQSMGSLRVGHD